MKGNVPISELPLDEEAWIVACVTSVREGTAKTGKRYFDATALNATGRIAIKIWQEAYDDLLPFRPGIWKLAGQKSLYLNQPRFVVSKYEEQSLEDYRGHQGADPAWPRAYTMDIETLALDAFRERAPKLLQRDFRLNKLRAEQLARYTEDAEAEAGRVYQLGSLAATSGRVISIAVQVAPLPEFMTMGGPRASTSSASTRTARNNRRKSRCAASWA